MTTRHTICLVAAVGCHSLRRPAKHALKKSDTIKSLEDKTVEVRPGKIVLDSSELARESYRDFLDLVSDDPESARRSHAPPR